MIKLQISKDVFIETGWSIQKTPSGRKFRLIEFERLFDSWRYVYGYTEDISTGFEIITNNKDVVIKQTKINGIKKEKINTQQFI